jgi:apolipoprotein N-acyltransferase
MSYQTMTLPGSHVDHDPFISSNKHLTENDATEKSELAKFFGRFPEKELGYVLLAISAVLAGFGNSLNPVSILTMVHIYLLLVGFELALGEENIKSTTCLILSIYLVISQALGFCLGFNGIFGFPTLTASAVFASIGFGLLLWVVYLLLALLPYFLYIRKYPSHWTNYFLFPTLHTVAYCTLLGSSLSTFGALGNGNLDYSPLRQFAVIFGVYGVNFLTVWIGWFPSYYHSRYNGLLSSRQKKNHFHSWLLGLVLLFMITGFLVQSKYLYQKHVNRLISPTLPVSCVFSQAAEFQSPGFYSLWNSTADRIAAGDGIVLMSEEAMFLKNSDQETAVIDLATELANRSPNKDGVLVGVTYELQLPGQDFVTNQFVLIASSSSNGPLWHYRKAHPVPLIEDNVRAGAGNLPIAETNYGKLSGGICFDLDFPQYIASAGRHEVDLFLQPSWTWNAINSRHFDGDSLRAMENGFTLFRCSSDGESGIVDPYGKFLARQETGHDPSIVSTFQLPRYDHVTSFYANLGFTFEYFLIVAAFFYYLSIFYQIIPTQANSTGPNGGGSSSSTPEK